MKIAMISNSSSGLYSFRRDLILRLVSDGKDVVALTPLGERVDQLETLTIRIIDTKIDRRGMNPIHDISLLIIIIMMQ